jgi:hypothetical protein
LKRVMSTYKTFLFNFKSFLFQCQFVSNNFFYFMYLYEKRDTLTKKGTLAMSKKNIPEFVSI